MRLNTQINLANGIPSGWASQLVQGLTNILSQMAIQINGLTEGSGNNNILHSALPGAPISGTWSQNDFIPNSLISEMGIIGTKYIVVGYRCVESGTPGIWVEQRCLTGN